MKRYACPVCTAIFICRAGDLGLVDTAAAARAKIANRANWCKGALAKRSYRSQHSVPFYHAEAGAWCAYGAAKAVDGTHEDLAVHLLAHAARPGVAGLPSIRWIYDYNDAPGTRHAGVLAMYDRAIALATLCESTATEYVDPYARR
jgi:hypothetical protein